MHKKTLKSALQDGKNVDFIGLSYSGDFEMLFPSRILKHSVYIYSFVFVVRVYTESRSLVLSASFEPVQLISSPR